MAILVMYDVWLVADGRPKYLGDVVDRCYIHSAREISVSRYWSPKGSNVLYGVACVWRLLAVVTCPPRGHSLFHFDLYFF